MNEWIVMIFIAGQMGVSDVTSPTLEKCEENTHRAYLLLKQVNPNYSAQMICVRKDQLLSVASSIVSK